MATRISKRTSTRKFANSLEKLTYPERDKFVLELLDQHMTTLWYDLLAGTELTAIAIENFVYECHKPDTIIVHGVVPIMSFYCS